jgi:hypothetical protein
LRVKDHEFILILFLHLSNPFVSLELRVDHQWEHSAFPHKDTVFLAELIIGQTLEAPFDEIDGLNQELWEIVVA